MKTPSGAELDWKRAAVLAVALALGLFFWDSPVLWPLKLLVVAMHESGHALATLLVGGQVQSLTIAANESGACVSRLPSSWFGQLLVYSGGYVGSAVAGGAMMLATFRFRLRRAVLVATCVWLAALGVVFSGDLFTTLFCLGTAAALGLAAKLLPADAVDVLNLFIAAFSGLYVVFDLRDDLWNHHVRAVSDAALLAQLTFVPAIVWALVWSVISLAILGFAAWHSVRKGRALASPEEKLERSLRARSGP